MRRNSWVLAQCLFLWAALVRRSPASVKVFHEDFNGSDPDPTQWMLDVGDGFFVLANGHATLSFPGGGDFPYLTAKQNFFPATDDFLIEVGFCYPYALSGAMASGPSSS
jgi:hypothetical protein